MLTIRNVHLRNDPAGPGLIHCVDECFLGPKTRGAAAGGGNSWPFHRNIFSMVKNAPPLPDTEEIDHLLVNDTAFLELLDQFKGSLYTTELQDNPRLRAKFLKEADNDLTKTIKLLRDCLTWRQDMGVDSAISWKFPMVEAIKETYPHRYCGYSREGHPIYMERLGLAHIRQTLTHIPMDDFTRYHILHW